MFGNKKKIKEPEEKIEDKIEDLEDVKFSEDDSEIDLNEKVEKTSQEQSNPTFSIDGYLLGLETRIYEVENAIISIEKFLRQLIPKEQPTEEPNQGEEKNE